MTIVNLEDCCEILDSKRIPITATNRKSGPYPYYGANGVQDYVSDYIFDDELVLLAEDGGNFNSSTKPIAYRVSGKCWVNNHAHVLKALPSIDVDYLCYSLMFYKVGSLVNGATREKLTQAAMRRMKIHLRPMSKQVSIVSTLSKTKRIINLRRAQLAKLDELVKCRFIELFGDPVFNEKKWSTRTLKELTTKVGSGATPKGGDSAYKESGISLIRSLNVHNNVFSFRDLAHIDDKQAEQLSNVTVQPDDVLLNITGASVARCCIVDDDALPARVNQHVCIIRCHDEMSPLFLVRLLTSDNFQAFLWDIAEGGGGTRQALTKQQIENFCIITPPLALQTAFADFVRRIDKSRFVVKEGEKAVKTLKGLGLGVNEIDRTGKIW